jgi:Ca-activated chloride channel homolog
VGRIHPVCVGLCIVLTLGAQETAVFRSDVRLVRVVATVKDPNGTPVGSLEKNNFKVFDSGVEQQISVFERHTEQPLSVSVLLDTSGSTNKELKYETDSVSRFLKALFREGNPDDQAALYTFNWQVVVLKYFTRHLEDLQNRLRGLKGEGGTSLYDAMYFAARDIAGREGRHVMIIVTDGGDTTSAKTYHQALDSAQQSDSVIYPILVVPITNDAGRNIGGENALTTIAAGTGGRVFWPSVGAQLDNAFADILRDLRTQYLIGYYPKNIPSTKNRFHQLKITVDRPDLRVQTRSGYYGDAER